MADEPNRALVLGATGLVGNHLLMLLRDSGIYDHVYTVSRRPPAVEHATFESRVGDMEAIESMLDGVVVEDVFCCLGTTIRNAGSREAFEFVDRELPVRAARYLKDMGMQHFLIVTALGADASSKIFYNRVKGQVEEDLSALELPALSIFRPSLLTGHRNESRPMEKLSAIAARGVEFAMVGPLRNYRPIAAGDVALAMVRKGQAGGVGTRIYSSPEIKELADSL